MAGQLKLRRGTTSQLANYIGSEGELTYNTTLRSLVLHDGVTLGGVKIPYLSNDLVPSTMLPTATESVIGASKIATTAIAQAGTNDTDIITPKKLKDVNKMLKGWFKTSGVVVSGFGGSGIVGITRVSLGVYTINTSFNVDENPVFLGLVKSKSLPEWAGTVQLHPTILPTVNSITIITKASGTDTFIDYPYVCFGVF